jgi:rubrerythrin
VRANAGRRMNLTGMNMQPMESSKMREAGRLFPPTMDGDDTLILEQRSLYLAEGEPIGSIPAALSPRGVVETLKGAVTDKSPATLMDKLGERLAFERTGTRLYQAMLGKIESTALDGTPMVRGEVQRILKEEHEHFLILTQAIEQLGGDPTAVTPAADIAGVASIGLVQILSDPRTTVAQSMSALLIAELTDNDCWQVLVDLADALGYQDLAAEFRLALADEDQHLAIVRRWIQAATLEEAGLAA